MATIDVLGGIGKGLMAGSEFIHRQRQADAQQAHRDQLLSNQQQQLQMQQDTLQIKKDELSRLDKLGTLKNELAQNYPEATDPYQRQQLFISEGVKRNLFRGDELDKAYDMRTKLRTQFGTQAYDSALTGDIKPLQTLLGERGISADFTPDGKGINLWSAASKRDAQGNLQPIQTLSVEGLQQLDAMGVVRERELARRKALQEGMKNQADVSKTLAETNRANADADLKRATAAGKNPVTIDDNGNTVPNPLYAGGSRKRAGASGAGSDGAGGGTYEALGFKNQGEMQKWIGEALPDGGDMLDAEGRAVSVPRDQLLRSTETNLDLLLRANTGIAAPVARDIAVSMALTKLGAPAGDGTYVPTPQLNAESGEWETVVRTGDKIVAHVPSAVIEPTPEQVFEQESRYAERLSDQIGVELTEIAKNPKGREALSLAMRSPGAMAALEQKLGVPNLGRKLEVLYAYTGLGGAVLPDQRLNDKRAEVIRKRGQIPVTEAQSRQMPVSLFSADEKRHAEAIGAGRAIGATDVAQAGLSVVGKGLHAVGSSTHDALMNRSFSLGLDAARKTNFRVRNVVESLAKMIRDNPQFRQELTDEDLFRLQFALDERL